MPVKLELNRHCRETAEIYVAGLREACAAKGKRPALDPIQLLIAADEHPVIVRGTEMVEYMIGWLTGVAEANGVDVEVLWHHLAPSPAAKATRKRAKAA